MGLPADTQQRFSISKEFAYSAEAMETARVTTRVGPRLVAMSRSLSELGPSRIKRSGYDISTPEQISYCK
ncbi:hypothetical protein C443_13607 [Haloarcula argentinensis DSM 12282]|nr:hypothetical protein C443_13607 [Haloarcula argentinensis DSM 12282]